MTGTIVDKTLGASSAKQATTRKESAPDKAAITPKASKKGEKEKKVKGKLKVIRDFSMPQAEYEKLAKIKQDCIAAGIPVKKNELLRAGLHVLGRLNVPQLKQALSQVLQIKAGRRKQKDL